MVFIISLILPPAVHSTLEMAACCWGIITVVSVVSGQQTEYKLCIADTAAQTQKCCSSYYWKEFIFFITFNRPGRIVLCIVVTMIHNDNIVSRSCANTCSHDSLVPQQSKYSVIALLHWTADIWIVQILISRDNSSAEGGHKGKHNTLVRAHWGGPINNKLHYPAFSGYIFYYVIAGPNPPFADEMCYWAKNSLNGFQHSSCI